MKFFYGTNENKIDVTDIILKNWLSSNTIHIPNDDIVRFKTFNKDPAYGVVKSIFILTDDNKETEIDSSTTVEIFLDTKQIIIKKNVANKLSSIQNSLNLAYGHWNEEYPEQLLSVCHIEPDAKVLEIGGNIGRNSLIIASLLNNQENLVVLETNKTFFEQLEFNRQINKYSFNTENAGLSNHKLIQRGWNTFTIDKNDPTPDGFVEVNTISYKDLINKYKIKFDTLVLDCEGAFYYIVKDMPEILDNIKLVIIENDFNDPNHKHYVDKILQEHNLKPVVKMEGGWGHFKQNFYEVWKLC